MLTAEEWFEGSLYHFCPTGTGTATGVGDVAETFAQEYRRRKRDAIGRVSKRPRMLLKLKSADLGNNLIG